MRSDIPGVQNIEPRFIKTSEIVFCKLLHPLSIDILLIGLFPTFYSQ